MLLLVFLRNPSNTDSTSYSSSCRKQEVLWSQPIPKANCLITALKLCSKFVCYIITSNAASLLYHPHYQHSASQHCPAEPLSSSSDEEALILSLWHRSPSAGSTRQHRRLLWTHFAYPILNSNQHFHQPWSPTNLNCRLLRVSFAHPQPDVTSATNVPDTAQTSLQVPVGCSGKTLFFPAIMKISENSKEGKPARVPVHTKFSLQGTKSTLNYEPLLLPKTPSFHLGKSR